MKEGNSFSPHSGFRPHLGFRQSLAYRRLPYTDQVRRSRGRRIGILGGSFNPAHVGHRHISLQAIRRLDLDEVWWLLTPQNPLKNEDETAAEEKRYASCLKLTKHPRLFVTRFEFGLKTTYTADTLKLLKREMPGKQFVWLMGADNLVQFHRWHRWREIIDEVPLGIMSRPGSSRQALASVTAKKLKSHEFRGRNIADQSPPAWRLVSGPRVDISSTEIRSAGLF